MNKSIFILTALCFGMIGGLYAQHKMVHQKVNAYKIAYLTEKLDLTPEEAQKFWPLYNEFHKNEDSLQRLEHKRLVSPENLQAMSEKDVEAFVDQRLVHMQQMLDLKKYYHQKFKEILPIKKVARLYIAEKEFKKYILNQFKGQRGGGMHHGQGGPHHGGPAFDMLDE